MANRNAETLTDILIFVGVVLTFGANNVFQQRIEFLDSTLGRYILFGGAIILFYFSNRIASSLFPNTNSLGNQYIDKILDRFAIVTVFYVLSIWLAPIIQLNPLASFLGGVFIMVVAADFAKKVIFKGG